MNFRMKRLDPSIHHFRKPGQFGNVLYLQSGRGNCLGGAAGRDKFDTVAGEGTGQFDQPGFVGNGQQSAGHASRMVRHASIPYDGLAGSTVWPTMKPAAGAILGAKITVAIPAHGVPRAWLMSPGPTPSSA